MKLITDFHSHKNIKYYNKIAVVMIKLHYILHIIILCIFLFILLLIIIGKIVSLIFNVDCL